MNSMWQDARITGISLVVLGTLLSPAGPGASAPLEAQDVGASLEARVWLGGGGDAVFQRGDRVRIYYRTTTDAYVALFRIDTDGIVRLLHPRVPYQDHYVRGGRAYRLRVERGTRWYVDDYPGSGYFFVVASRRPMDFSRLPYSHAGGGWDLGTVGRRVYQDPYLAMDDFVAALIPDWRRAPYALDFVEYHVGRSYDYPRFLCYDCHQFRPYRSWNPYRYQCHSFRLIVHTDPFFYPVTRYRGTRVVYARPPIREAPRFVFKERAAGEPAAPIFRPLSETRMPGVAGAERRRSTGGTAAPAPAAIAAPRRTGDDGGRTRTAAPRDGAPSAVSPGAAPPPAGGGAPRSSGEPRTGSPGAVGAPETRDAERSRPSAPVLPGAGAPDRGGERVGDDRGTAVPPVRVAPGTGGADTPSGRAIPRVRGGSDGSGGASGRAVPEVREQRDDPPARPSPSPSDVLRNRRAVPDADPPRPSLERRPSRPAPSTGSTTGPGAAGGRAEPSRPNGRSRPESPGADRPDRTRTSPTPRTGSQRPPASSGAPGSDRSRTSPRPSSPDATSRAPAPSAAPSPRGDARRRPGG